MAGNTYVSQQTRSPSAELEVQCSLSYAQNSSKSQPFSLNVDLRLPLHGVTGIFGSSGSGKTSLLRCIAGLQKAPNSTVRVAGQYWQQGSFFLPTHKRRLAYVFQETSLFSHLSALGNLRFSMRRAWPGSPVIGFDEAVSMLALDHLLARRPEQLSGGERQRVAIARALLVNPQILLMDEPLASLDEQRKEEILPYLDRLRRDLNMPVLYVSHAISELTRLADQLLILKDGAVLANGRLSDLLTRLDLPLAGVQQVGVVIEAEIIELDNPWQLALAKFSGGQLWLVNPGEPVGKRLRLHVLANDVSLALTPPTDSSIQNILPAIVDQIASAENGAMLLVRLRLGDTFLLSRITCRSADKLQLAPGKMLWAQLKAMAVLR